MNKPQILIDAENNWPEDEASRAYDVYVERCKEGEFEWALKCLANDVAHMTGKVFASEADKAELTQRYNAKLAELRRKPIFEAQVAIQCVNPDTGETGTWLFKGESHRIKGTAVSPVFPDCYALFKWCQPNGFINSLGGSYLLY